MSSAPFLHTGASRGQRSLPEWGEEEGGEAAFDDSHTTAGAAGWGAQHPLKLTDLPHGLRPRS